MISTFIGIVKPHGICAFLPETESSISQLSGDPRTLWGSVCFWAAVNEELASAIHQALSEDDRVHALYLLEAYATFLGRISPKAASGN